MYKRQNLYIGHANYRKADINNKNLSWKNPEEIDVYKRQIFMLYNYKKNDYVYFLKKVFTIKSYSI